MILNGSDHADDSKIFFTGNTFQEYRQRFGMKFSLQTCLVAEDFSLLRQLIHVDDQKDRLRARLIR